MRKEIKQLQVGIYFSPDKSLGGGYQYAVSVLRALLKTDNEIHIFSSSSDLPKIKKNKMVHLYKIGTKSTDIIDFRDRASNFFAKHFPWVTRLSYKLGLFNLLYLVLRVLNKKTISIIDSKKLDIIFFPIPIYLSTMLETQVVVSVLDLEHLSKRKFKETSAGGRWEYREFGYRKIAQKAWRIFVDSEKSRCDMKKFYRANQTVILRYVPPSDLKIKLAKSTVKAIDRKFSLKRRYVFYPAKFWPHKNHLNLIKAVEILNNNNFPVDLVLTGSKKADFSTFDMVQNYIKTSNLNNVVKYFGYVSYDELSYLYQHALCMTMPTFLGPTNIPVYEAWRMGTPVVYSDIEGCKDQLGEAGLLVNPGKPDEIASAIEKLYKSNKLRKDLIKKGNRRLSAWTNKDFVRTIKEIISEYGQNYN